MEKQGLPEPEYEVAGGFVGIVFRRPEGAGVVNGVVNGPVNGPVNGDVNGQLNGTLNGTLNERQKSVLDFIAATPGVQARVIIDKLLIPRDTLNKILKVLMDRDLIEHRGSKKTGGYYSVAKK